MNDVSYNRTQTLKFWCQKVLPLVYDDSLSYYELLNKVVAYLNSTIEDVTRLIDEVDSIIINLDNVAFIDDDVVSSDKVWSSLKVNAVFPKINDSGTSNNGVWSSQHTNSEISNKITERITNNPATSTTQTWSSNYINSRLSDKVDKVTGKGLSTNDFTNEEKTLVAGAIQSSEKGANNGVATLGSDGKLTSSQLPASVDEIKNGYLYNGAFYSNSQHTEVIPAVSDAIYVDLITNKTYRWSGSAYIEISESLALGETSSTAYAGNKGKQNADNISAINSKIPSNASSTNKLVDSDTMVSALNNKVDKVAGKGLSTNDYTNEDKTIVGGVTSALAGKFPRSEQVILGAKNLLTAFLTSESKTTDNAIFTVNSDGTVDLSTSDVGTGTRVLEKTINLTFTEDIILSGCPTNGGLNNYQLDLNAGAYADTGEGILIPANTNLTKIRIRVASTYNNSNAIKFKPMLRIASDPNDTYVPYTMTNKELTEKSTTKEYDSSSAGFSTTKFTIDWTKSKMRRCGNIGMIALLVTANETINAYETALTLPYDLRFKPDSSYRYLLTDNRFALGGNSIYATQQVAQGTTTFYLCVTYIIE